MGNNSAKQLPPVPKYDRRPHSVLGLRDCEPDYFVNNDGCDRFNTPNESGMRNLNNRGNRKAILPPLPRSQSFHHILRSTENGVNLLQKGTIRGADSGRPIGGKGVLQVEEEEILSPELNAILRQRRCKSETDLHYEQFPSENAENEEISNKSIDSRNEVARKGLTNGVAARIQRAKYKAPPPPPQATDSVPPLNRSNLRANNKGHSNGNIPYPEGSMTDNLRGSKRSLGNPESRNFINKPKASLVRRLSENSYSPSKSKEKSDQERDLMRILRLRPTVFCAKKERNTVFDSKVDKNGIKANSPENQAPKPDSSEKVKKAAVVRSSSNHYDRPKYHLGEESTKQKEFYNGKKSVISPFGKLDRQGLPLTFDDNFILKRVTPTAGLSNGGLNLSSSPQRSDTSYGGPYLRNFPTYEFENNENRNQENQPFQVSGRKSFPESRFSPMPQSNKNNGQFNGFPKYKYNGGLDYLDNKQSACSRIGSKPSNAYVSDSANYSDYDEDDSRELLHPYMSDLHKTSFSQESEEASNRSIESRGEGGRKGLTNGVAARIQRAKYKVIGSPGLTNESSSPFQVNASNNNGINGNHEAKAFENLRGSKRSLGNAETRDSKEKSKVNLVRRSSEKSYVPPNNGKDELDRQGDLMRLLRLRPEIFAMKNSQNATLDSEPEEEPEDDYGRPSSTEKSRLSAMRSTPNDHDRSQYEEYVPPAEMFSRHNKPKMIRGPQVLPTTFDDNFILRRATPSAGLTPLSGEINLFSHPLLNRNYKKGPPTSEFERQEKERENSPFYTTDNNVWPDHRPQGKLHRNESGPTNELPKYVFSGDMRYSEEKRITPKRVVHKMNNSYVSDSANYSDYEDGEDEVRLANRSCFSPTRTITNGVGTPDDGVTKNPIPSTRHMCWTPLEDLTSSEEEEEDLINSDQPSDDDELLRRRRDVQDMMCDNSTRFTLQNQLRTLIHNNKLKHMYP